MLRIGFDVWRDGSAATLRLQLAALLSSLVALDEIALRANPRLPRLYDSGVRYRAEAPGAERWRDIPTILAQTPLVADCEDLSAWRVAELRREGIKAVPGIMTRDYPGGVRLAHIFVRLPGGGIEDPSVRLGMRPIPAGEYNRDA